MVFSVKRVVLATICVIQCACAPVSQTVVLQPIKSAKGIGDIEKHARELGNEYHELASQSANSARLLEVPIIAAALTGASLLAFGAHPDAAIVTSIVGGSAGALSTYLSPRDTALIYADGAVASRCIMDVAADVKFALTTVNVAMLSNLGTSQSDLGNKLRDALDSVTLRILQRVVKDAQPNIQEIVNGITIGQQMSAQKLRMIPLGISPFNQKFVEIIANVEKRLGECKAKAG